MTYPASDDEVEALAKLVDQINALLSFTNPVPPIPRTARLLLKRASRALSASQAGAASGAVGVKDYRTMSRNGIRVFNENGKRWCLESVDGRWTMKPEGFLSADEARALCERVFEALTAAPSPSPSSAGDENDRLRDRVMELEAKLAKPVEEPMFPIMGGPAIPFSLIAPYEAQAQKNHGQTLKRLSERGGLSITEAMAVMSSVAYEKRPIAKPTVEDWLDFIAARKARAEARSTLGGSHD